MNSFLFIAILVGTYLLFALVSRKLFYQGKLDHENYMVFNVSSVVEYAQISVFLLVALFQVYSLATTLPVWYEWIIPVIIILVFLTRGLLKFSNRNNFIKIRGNEVIYQTDTSVGQINMKAYKIYEGEGIHKNNWFLEIKGTENGEDIVKEFHLNDLQLHGFRKSMIRYFEAQQFKKIEALH